MVDKQLHGGSRNSQALEFRHDKPASLPSFLSSPLCIPVADVTRRNFFSAYSNGVLTPGTTVGSHFEEVLMALAQTLRTLRPVQMDHLCRVTECFLQHSFVTLGVWSYRNMLLESHDNLLIREAHSSLIPLSMSPEPPDGIVVHDGDRMVSACFDASGMFEG